ncbi:hypothetical protein [Serratia fonticola]|uniref:hypothetical protein n=1 Tax=Serratia fonticola TaxID=47917 RepID=UPI0013774D02|nr:hypothetical protein [Serratia fonticola]NCG55234.1 hypothetical protein [Serratia fonticola]
MNSNNKVDQLLQESTRANGKRLLSQDEAVSLAAVVITPKRSPAEQAQRDQFLAAVKEAKNWSTMLTFYTEHENWSEVEFLLGLSDRVCEKLQEAFAHTNQINGH